MYWVPLLWRRVPWWRVLSRLVPWWLVLWWWVLAASATVPRPIAPRVRLPALAAWQVEVPGRWAALRKGRRPWRRVRRPAAGLVRLWASKQVLVCLMREHATELLLLRWWCVVRCERRCLPLLAAL